MEKLRSQDSGVSDQEKLSGQLSVFNDQSLYNEDYFKILSAFDHEKNHGPNTGGYFGGVSTASGSGSIKSTSMIDTYYIYSFDGKLMAEYDHDGNCVKDYIYAGNRLIAEYQPQTNKYYYYMSDQINSTRIVTDDNGDRVYSAAHRPFGKFKDVWTKTYDPKLKFSGKEREDYSDLDYFGARYYDHNSYRFISVDSIKNKKGALANPQLWNLYAYCGNNPITYFDPDGRLRLKLNAWQVVNKRHPSGRSTRGRTGYLLTDDGKSKVVATKYGKKQWRTNCIGFVFAEGKYWINPKENGTDQIQKILKGDNYKVGLKVGGVVLFKTAEDIYLNGTKIHNAGDYVHAAKVTSIENGTVMVTGIGGLGSEPETTEVGKGWRMSSFKVEYYHKKTE